MSEKQILDLLFIIHEKAIQLVEKGNQKEADVLRNTVHLLLSKMDEIKIICEELRKEVL